MTYQTLTPPRCPSNATRSRSKYDPLNHGTLSVTCLVRKLCLGLIALTTAALLQCAIDAAPKQTAADGVGLGDVAAVSMAAVSRHCGDFLSSLSLGDEGIPREAKVDVPYWLDELENLKVGEHV